jgi:Type I restriction-modification system methyltransferase subunit
MSKANIIKMFEKLAYRHSLWEVYSDFLEMAALAISNSVDLIHYGAREKRYLEIIKKYNKEEAEIFPKLLGELVQALTEKTSDVLGEIFMELELGNKWKGQFFTPYNLCLASAKLMIGNLDKVIEEKGYVSLNEPCSGGGAMVIAFAEAMREQGYNPQKQLMAICQDLDSKAVHMSYIQLSLLGIPATVCHANTLSLEVFDTWKTPFWVLGFWDHKNLRPKPKPQYEFEVEESGQLKII